MIGKWNVLESQLFPLGLLHIYHQVRPFLYNQWLSPIFASGYQEVFIFGNQIKGLMKQCILQISSNSSVSPRRLEVID